MEINPDAGEIILASALGSIACLLACLVVLLLLAAPNFIKYGILAEHIEEEELTDEH